MLGQKLLEYLISTLAIDKEWSIRNETGFIWWPHRLAQRVWFEPVQVPDSSPYISVHAETAVLRNVPNTIETAQCLDLLNKFASMNALVWDSGTKRISYHCCMYVSDETFGWLKVVLAAAIAIQAVDAHIKATEDGATLFKAAPDESNHPQKGPRKNPDEMIYVVERAFAPVGKSPSPFEKCDFESVLRMEPCPWLMANGGGSGLTAEFAFEGDMPAAGLLMGLGEGSVQTTLFEASADEPHPQLGSGVLLRMTLPVTFDQEQAIAKVHELNQAETHENTFLYFMGAWCSVPQLQKICFVTFLPAMIHKTDLLQPFVWSMAVRSRWVKQHLSWH